MRRAHAWAQRVLRYSHRADPKIGLVLQDGGEPPGPRSTPRARGAVFRARAYRAV